MTVFLDDLKDRGVVYRELRVSHAFHSPDMDGAAEAFGASLQEASLARPTRMDMISTVSGRMATVEPTRTTYWRDQIVSPVRFLAAVQTMSEQCSLAIRPVPRPRCPDWLGNVAPRCGVYLH